MIHRLETICQVAKSLKTGVAKDGAVETVECELKFASLPVPRDVMDELLGLPIGWSAAALFDDQGAPLRLMSISVEGRALRVTGKISGPGGDPSLVLLQAELTEIACGLCNLGGVVEGKLTWPAKGDEVEDVMELLGKTCRVEWQVSDGKADDMFPASPSVTREAIRKIIQGPWASGGAQGSSSSAGPEV
jgi:hypothetical protein